jgi:HAD superfamily hydrolase (TIGR01509 family)
VMTQRTTVYPGVREVLARHRARNCRLAVCTNRDEPLALELLEGLGLLSCFDLVVGLRDGVEPKPHPRMLLSALEGLGTPPHEALMVGDSEVDMLCAAAAGVPCLLFSSGYGGDRLPASGAPKRFTTYTSLMAGQPHAEARP